MKKIVIVEIVVLALVVLIGAGMVLVSEGVLELFSQPVLVERQAPELPVDAVTRPDLPEATAAPEESTGADDRQITAEKYFAYDLREDRYLEKRGDSGETLYPASITKLLTCHVLLQHMDGAEQVTVGDALELVEPDSSLAGLEKGDTLTVEQLIAGMLLPSGNDAAQVAAVAAGRKIAGDDLPAEEAAEVFVEEMNRQAELLGMENSHFENPDGFHHDDHYTTMDDLVILCRTVLANPVILRYTSMVSLTVELPDRKLEWVNTNFLLDGEEDVYRAGTIGLKTGYTGKAGSCLVSAFFQEDRVILIGVFDCPAFTNDRYLDTVAIYDRL